MVQFTVAGRTWQLYTRTYTVKSVDVTTATEVSGGEVYTVGGQVMGNPIQSSTTQYRRVWLTDDDGVDRKFTPLCEVAPGHRVSILFFSLKKKDLDLAAYNFNTREIVGSKELMPFPDYMVASFFFNNSLAILSSPNPEDALTQIVSGGLATLEGQITKETDRLRKRRLLTWGIGAALLVAIVMGMAR